MRNKYYWNVFIILSCYIIDLAKTNHRLVTMPQNQTKKEKEKEKQEQSHSGGWLLPSLVGAAVGAAAVYLFSRAPSDVSHSEGSHTDSRSSRNDSGSTFHAPPRGCCTVCQDDYQDTVKLKCGHIIHKECYIALKDNTRGQLKCPVCRAPIAWF